MNMLKSKFLPVYLLTFVNGLSFTLLIPVFPFLIKFYDQPEIVLGLLAASYSFFQFFGTPILWDLSDKYGRKLVLFLTQWGTLLSWMLLAWAYFLPSQELFSLILLPVWVIFASRVIDWLTWGNMSVVSAMVADLTTPEERSTVLGKNSAVIGITLIIWPALWAFSMSTAWGYLGTAILGGTVSLITLIVMFFLMKETLIESKRRKDITISYRDLNIIKKLRKYWGIQRLQFSVWMKLFFNTGFAMYTTVSVLYLMDVFWFTEMTVGYYLIITWSFLIFHQAVSISPIVKKIGDLNWLLLGQLSMWFGFIWMWFSGSIYLYTFFYFFAVLGIALSWTTIQALFSKSADEKSQGEIMWIAGSLESIFSIIWPLLWTLLYAITHDFFYQWVWMLPILWLVFFLIFYKKKLSKHEDFCMWG